VKTATEQQKANTANKSDVMLAVRFLFIVIVGLLERKLHCQDRGVGRFTP
jgi:hypothetical protein